MEFQVGDASGGQYYWRIVGRNGEPLAHSETYVNKRDAIAACELVQANAAGAPIYDHTASAARV